MLTFRAMTSPTEWRCALADLAPGRTAKFRLSCGERRVNGFVVNHEGTVHAYVNRCPHVGTPLDLWENEFLSEDARLIVDIDLSDADRSHARRVLLRDRRPALYGDWLGPREV